MNGWNGGHDALASGYQRWLDGLNENDVSVRLHPLAFQPPSGFNGTWTISHWDPAHRCWHTEEPTTLTEFETEALDALCEERRLRIVERLRWSGPLLVGPVEPAGDDYDG